MPDLYTQINVLAPPSTSNHIVRLGDLKDAIESRFKIPVRVAATSNLVGTYAAGTKALTATADGLLSIDGITLALGNRVLLLGQTTATQNGIYKISSLGGASARWVLTRDSDFDDTSKIYAGVKVHVTEGNDNAEVTYVLATDDPIDLDTTPLIFTADTGLFPPIREYSVTLASGATTPVTVTHGLGTTSVTVEVIRVSDGETVLVGVKRDSANTVILNFYANLTESFLVLVRAVL
jgi:hypothetical protein